MKPIVGLSTLAIVYAAMSTDPTAAQSITQPPPPPDYDGSQSSGGNPDDGDDQNSTSPGWPTSPGTGGTPDDSSEASSPPARSLGQSVDQQMGAIKPVAPTSKVSVPKVGITPMPKRTATGNNTKSGVGPIKPKTTGVVKKTTTGPTIMKQQ